MELMCTMQPPPRDFMCSTACWLHHTVDSRLRSTTSFHCAALATSKAPAPPLPPTLLTRMSSAPKERTAISTAAWAPSGGAPPPPPTPPQPRRPRLQPLRPASAQTHLHALARQAQGDGPSDAPAAARHECRLAFEFQVHAASSPPRAATPQPLRVALRIRMGGVSRCPFAGAF